MRDHLRRDMMSMLCRLGGLVLRLSLTERAWSLLPLCKACRRAERRRFALRSERRSVLNVLSGVWPARLAAFELTTSPRILPIESEQRFGMLVGPVALPNQASDDERPSPRRP